MKPFAMDSVLKYRQQLEDAARQELFTAQEREADLRRQLGEAEAALEELCRNLENERRGATTAERLILYERRMQIVREQVAALAEKVAGQQERVRQRHRHLLKASQERKVLEKLREQQNRNYRNHLEKKEALMLDEIAVLFHER
ncbi:flagellar export protein FliJ [Thermodesulfobacteriota bacterium B35]